MFMKMFGNIIFIATLTSSWSDSQIFQTTIRSPPFPVRYEDHSPSYLYIRRDLANDGARSSDSSSSNSSRSNNVNLRHNIYGNYSTFISIGGSDVNNKPLNESLVHAADDARSASDRDEEQHTRGRKRRKNERNRSQDRQRRKESRDRKQERRILKQALGWAVSGGRKLGNRHDKNRYKNRYKNRHQGNRGNRTTANGRPRKPNVKSGWDMEVNRRKWNSPNRRGGLLPGGQYRTVDPRHDKVRRHIVRTHNILRSRVVPPAADMLAVGWYDTAAEQAQAWAEQCGTHTQPDHPSVRWTSRYGACGQNVLISPRKKRWSHVMRSWWSGRRHFRYGNKNNNKTVVSSYTQMAWYNSHQLGCGFAECSTTGGATFFRYVCNYCPAGNDPRRLSRPYMQGQSCRKCPDSCRSVCHRGRCKLCTNACSYSDLWVNCATLDKQWHEWLCNTKTTRGVERFKNCRATCQCMKHIT